MPKIIMHNQVSLDGAVSGFQINPATYYGIVNSYGAEMYLVGSNTAISGIKMFSKGVTPELKSDFDKPEFIENDNRPFWVIPDSEGKLQGLLHVYRRYEHCRDVILFVSAATPNSYLNYLDERAYTYFISGEIKVDYKKALEQLNQKIPFTKMITDNGGTLSSVLLEKSLIDQISLMISPTITDKKNPKLFRNIKLGKRVIKLVPTNAKILDSNDVLLLFDVVK